MFALISLTALTSVQAYELNSSGVQMSPNVVDTISTLLVISDPVTPVPVGGKIVLTYPS